MSSRNVFVQRIGLVGIADLVIGLNSIFLLPILTKILSIEDYGVWVQIGVTIGLIPAIVSLGLSYSMVRFLAATKNKSEIQEGFYSSLIVILFSSIIASILLYLFSGPIASSLLNDNLEITKALCLIIIIECINVHLRNFFRTFQKVKMYALFSIINTYFSAALVAYMVVSGHGILGAIIGLLASKFIVFLLMIALVVRAIGVRIPQFTHIKDYIAFGLPTIPWSLSSWITNSSDRYIIGLCLGVASVGYYSPCYYLGYIVTTFSAPLLFMLPVILSKEYDEDNINEVKLILSHSLKYFMALAIPTVFGLSLLSTFVLSALSTPDIASYAFAVTPFVALSGLFFGIYSVFYQPIALVKKTKFLGCVWIIAAILNFGLNLLFVPRLGIQGAAITTLAAYVVVLALTIHISRKYIIFYVDYLFIIKCILASVLMSILILVWYPKGLFDLLVMIGVSALVYFVCLLIMRGFDETELQYFRNIFKVVRV